MIRMKQLLAMVTVAGLLWAQAPPAKRPAPRKPAPSQTEEPDPLHWPIKEIRVEGAKAYTPAQVIQASGMKVGDMATKANFERARDRVLATGFFESFGWRYEPAPAPGSFIATFEIVEPATFLPWAMERLPLERAEAQARLKRDFPMLEEKLPPTEGLLTRMAASLQSLLAAKGVTETVVGRVSLVGTDQVTVIFGPKTAPPNVAEVRFTGARVIDPRYLMKAMADVAIGTPYIEANFRLFLDNQIRAMYEAVGRLRVTFPKLTVEPSKTVKGVVVTVQVEEGEPYVLDKLEVRGTSLPPEDIQEQGQFKTGEVVSFSDIAKGLIRVMDQLKQEGYMKASYKALRQLNDEKKTVTVFVDVDPGPQYRFGTLIIKGLDLESEPTMRKLWAMKPGDPFKGLYPDTYLKQVRDRGILDNLGDTKAEIAPNDKTLLVTVTLIFKGGPDPDAEYRKRQKQIQ